MTEAELRRLAELINELSPGGLQSFLETWGFLISFVLGVMATRFEAWLSARNQNWKILKPSREELYRILVNYRKALYEITQAGEASKDNNRIAVEIHNARLLISHNLTSTDDRKYARLTSDVVHIRDGQNLAERIEELDRIIKELKKDALPLYEVLTEQDNLEQQSRRNQQ